MVGTEQGALGLSTLFQELLGEEEGALVEASLPFVPPPRGVDAGLPEVSSATVSCCAVADASGACSPTGCVEFREAEMRYRSDEAQQIAELCGEMDSCIASLDQWREERERGVDALKKNLQAQYGFAYDDHVPPPVPWQEEESTQLDITAFCCAGSASECADAELEELVASPPGAASSRRRADDAWANPVVGDASLSALCDNAKATAADDDARISRLREEVEALRRDAETGKNDVAPGHHDETEMTNDCIDGLSAWCDEVDAVLGTSLVCGRIGDAQPTAQSCISLENLAEAAANGEAMQGYLDDAKLRIDAELGDLDAMLSACDAIYRLDNPDELPPTSH